jgi:hypothetical protein
VVTLTTRQQPPKAMHWSTRTLAAAVGISEASVRRIWPAHRLKPHRVETFKISNDPKFCKRESAKNLFHMFALEEIPSKVSGRFTPAG